MLVGNVGSNGIKALRVHIPVGKVTWPHYMDVSVCELELLLAKDHLAQGEVEVVLTLGGEDRASDLINASKTIII